MMSRIFYEDGVREPEQPPEHHDPPLGRDKEVIERLEAYIRQSKERHWCGLQGFGLHYSDVCPACERAKCPDCHYPFDGDGWVLCDAHKEEE